MKIIQLAPLWKPVPPTQYGGSELVVSLLTEELVKAGHDVILLASGGSRTKARLIEAVKEPLFETLGRFDFGAVQLEDLLSLDQAFRLAKAERFDVIHNHMRLHTALFSDYSPVPMLTTNHSSVEPDFIEVAHRAKDANYVSISNAQRKMAPYLNYVETIYHGIDTSQFSYNEKPDEYLLFFATLWKEKGIDRAVAIARKAHMKLVIAGDIRRQSDFDEIKPFIDGKNIVFMGEIDFKTKHELLRNAKAYLFPIRWNEAFGLTVIEALACGTPVIAWPQGSLPELIEDGTTGFLVTSVAAAIAAVERIALIDRHACRMAAEKKFDARVMAQQYVKLYQKLLQ